MESWCCAPSLRGVSNYGRVISLLCQVKSAASSCVIAAALSNRAAVKCCRLWEESSGYTTPFPVEKIRPFQAKQGRWVFFYTYLCDVLIRLPGRWSPIRPACNCFASGSYLQEIVRMSSGWKELHQTANEAHLCRKVKGYRTLHKRATFNPKGNGECSLTSFYRIKHSPPFNWLTVKHSWAN